MPDKLIDWIVRFSTQCALNYATISVATAFVCAVMALVLLLVRQQVLKEEQWLWYLGWAFGTFTMQYGGRSAAAWIRSEYSREAARHIEQASQAIFSNLNSLLFLLAALSLLYRLPAKWWTTRWQLLIWLFIASSFFGLRLSEPSDPQPSDRYLDGGLSAFCLLILSYAMYASSGTRQRRGWALANLFGGIGYAGLQLVYAYAPTFSKWPRIAAALQTAVDKYKPVAQLEPQKILDSGLFALAFLFKVGLFTAALLVVMRCLAAFAPDRDVLKLMKTARGEFLGASGIVQTMGESIGADTAVLFFRLPSADRDEVQYFRWWRDAAQDDIADSIARPLPDQSILGRTLVAELDIVLSANVAKDPRFKGLDAAELGSGMNSFLSVVLRYHGAVIGSLTFAWKKTSAFTATDVQRARQIADFVTPTVQAERWLRASNDLRKRLQPYSFLQEEREHGTFIERVANELHDILSPIGTLIIVDFGFGIQWALREGQTRSSDQSKDSRSLEELEDYFRRVINGLEAREEETLLMLGGNPIGKLVFAAGNGHDPFGRPSLTQDKQQMNAITALVRDIIFDLHRKRFSSVVYRLQSRLNAEGVTEAHWIQCVREALTDVGLSEIVVSPNKSLLSRDGHPAITISREALTSPEMHGGYRIHQWHPDEGTPQSVVELPLTSNRETLFVAIPRMNFGRELDAELPWKLFFDRLAGAADSTLVRIRAVDLESVAMQFVITELLLHELRSPAFEFEIGAGAVVRRLKSSADDDLRELLESLKRSASAFKKLADLVLDPLRRDPRLSVPLVEVLKDVESFYQPRLPVGKIDLRRGPVEDHWSVRVPFHLAYVVLIGLIRNAREAIGANTGRIDVEAEAGTDAILLHVDDTGCGISKQNRDKVFKGYSTKPSGKGRFLEIARWAVRRHNGDLILAESAPEGVSTRFTISFSRELT